MVVGRRRPAVGVNMLAGNEAGVALAFGLAFGAWALCVAVACVMQERMIFGRPRRVRGWDSGPHVGEATRRVEIKGSGGVRLGGWLTQASEQTSNVLVWFPGRNENIGWVRGLASWLGSGWVICAFDYRGLGMSEGKPGETACVEDGVVIVDWISQETGVPHDRMVLVGRSLGSCIAMQVASKRSVGGVGLIAPPASVSRLVQTNPLLKPAGRWLRHRFDSLACASTVPLRALVLLAESDKKVPHSESRKLVEAIERSGSATEHGECRVVTIKGTNHCTVGRQADCLREIATFAQKVASGQESAGAEAGANQNKATLSTVF
jgi:uncharacterized protein